MSDRKYDEDTLIIAVTERECLVTRRPCDPGAWTELGAAIPFGDGSIRCNLKFVRKQFTIKAFPESERSTVDGIKLTNISPEKLSQQFQSTKPGNKGGRIFPGASAIISLMDLGT